MTAILLLNYEYPPLGGGAGNATYYILREYADFSDFQITLVTASTASARLEKPADNITIHFLDIGKRGSLHYQSNRDLIQYTWKAWRFCRRWIKNNPVDLVHAFFSIPGGLIARTLGLPYIVSLRGSDVPFYNPRFYWLDKLILKRLHYWIWRGTQQVIANSQGLRSLALQSYPKQEISVIPNGVDVDEFSPLADKPTHDQLRLISTGRLIERKGYPILFEALVGMDNVTLTLVGDGDQREYLQNLADEYRLQVDFKGLVPHTELPSLLRAADLFVLPSINEGMPNAALEAMACGLPVILTDTGGSLELVSNNGIIVPKGDASALQEAVLKYKQNPALLQSHSACSRKIAENMSWQNVAESYREVYKKITLKSTRNSKS